MDAKKFEKLIELIINENEEQARELFHDIVVEKSREIYESIMDEEMMGDDMGGAALPGLGKTIKFAQTRGWNVKTSPKKTSFIFTNPKLQAKVKVTLYKDKDYDTGVWAWFSDEHTTGMSGNDPVSEFFDTFKNIHYAAKEQSKSYRADDPDAADMVIALISDAPPGSSPAQIFNYVKREFALNGEKLTPELIKLIKQETSSLAEGGLDNIPRPGEPRNVFY